jgi:hypothetical protein
MRDIKLFEEWLLETVIDGVEISDRVLQKYIDTVIYYCLEALSPDGGNADVERSRNAAMASRPDLFDGVNGPDIWVAPGNFDGKIQEELKVLSAIGVWEMHSDYPREVKRVKEEFAKYGMEISVMKEHEVFVSLAIPYSSKTYNLKFIEANTNAIIKFYEKTRPEGLKELGEELRIHFKAKEYGV